MACAYVLSGAMSRMTLARTVSDKYLNLTLLVWTSTSTGKAMERPPIRTCTYWLHTPHCTVLDLYPAT